MGECDACVLQNSAIQSMNSGYYVLSLPQHIAAPVLSLATLERNIARASQTGLQNLIVMMKSGHYVRV